MSGLDSSEQQRQQQQQQAGEVFTSDGLPPLEPPKAPVLSSLPDVTNGVLDDGGGVGAVQAFEVFSGRLFPPRPRTTNNSAADVGDDAPKETPYQRLARLRSEVEELEKDLAASANDGDAVPGVDVLRDLTARLEAASADASPRDPRSAQADLADLVARRVERLRRGGDEEKEETTTTTMENARSAGDAPAGADVTYELWPGSSSSSSSDLERRLARVERVLGGGVAATSDGSVLRRLEKAERAAKLADETSLEAAAAKAKLIRVDLEAAARSRSRSVVPAEDAAIVSALHDQMRTCEGLTEELPALVARLTDLRRLHGDAADAVVRLAELEKSAARIGRTLDALEGLVERAEKGCAANAATMERNLRTLDERMERLRVATDGAE